MRCNIHGVTPHYTIAEHIASLFQPKHRPPVNRQHNLTE
nr:MAG TPA: hypothetical protein [Caudoviricetes sp.]